MTRRSRSATSSTSDDEPLGGVPRRGCRTSTNADFGYVTYSSIGDTVWLDSDADGLYEPETGELGVNGVRVELFQGGQLLDFTITGNEPLATASLASTSSTRSRRVPTRWSSPPTTS